VLQREQNSADLCIIDPACKSANYNIEWGKNVLIRKERIGRQTLNLAMNMNTKPFEDDLEEGTDLCPYATHFQGKCKNFFFFFS
jgi:hypothetical protein